VVLQKPIEPKRVLYQRQKKFVRETLNFSDITIKFLEGYKEYMIVELANTQNTRVKSFSFMKSIINKAIKKGIVKENVFQNFSLPKKNVNRESLSLFELNILESMLDKSDLTKTHRRALIPFIFSCYTGLRYQDICNLRFKDIKISHIGGKEQKVVKIVMHKTKDFVEVPLASEAINLISSGGLAEQKIFRVYKSTTE
jgi:site-specific recombinase XerD